VHSHAGLHAGDARDLAFTDRIKDKNEYDRDAVSRLLQEP
jgi:hypothetical protein